ncbi:hypothetical protein HOD05_05640 [Candidatus Woesearchaeota archaeon]|jgi:hypothetical protein|nr:hypothetical protein [Candidatus Woesearchaeota archaeon]MBT4150471.1 hypothetical protein [Candidatus Woesearchaeota archaeon]MBT4247738.1 hypothetical protein [Candidatus Woesearchaeota archaeon]MBT4434663.1 hypothetical protein [Candidatus Woesearchaeota archaeon]MBT7332446.1 hypothetical protein [Candidatus Woesearchaeota archaeon]
MDYDKKLRKASRLVHRINNFPSDNRLVQTLEAIEFTKELYDSHRTPETVDILVSAICHANNFEAAAKLLDEELERFPDASELHYDVAEIHLALYHQSEPKNLDFLLIAKNHIKQAGNLSPRDGRFHMTLADIYWYERKEIGSFIEYKKAERKLSFSHSTPFTETSRKKHLANAKKAMKGIQELRGPILTSKYWPMGDGRYHDMGILGR